MKRGAKKKSNYTLSTALSILYIASVLAILSQSAFALTTQEIDRVIINSADWRDVYSGMMYSNLEGKASNFLVSTRHSTLLLNQLDRASKNILVISSKKNPYVVGYAPLLESRNFVVEEQTLDSANLALAKRMDDITNYVVIDDAYGYNAISVAPYAAKKRSFVLFADSKNADDVATFLEQRKAAGKLGELIMYGTVDREVKTALAGLNPIIINKGDRFENNIEIVKRYQAFVHQGQAILSNGEFIESSIMNGAEPVLFIGSSNVPDAIAEYLKTSEIQVGILIGNELIGTATTVRRQIGKPVFVKFAQSARAPQGSISPVEDLDRFPMPKYYLDLSIYSARYNSATKQIEITFKNNVALGTFVKTTVTLRYGNGATQRVGDAEPVFVDKNGFLTVTYDVEPMDGNITAEIFAIYGEGRRSLEHVLRQTISVQTVQIFDESEISIDSVVYDKSKGAFLIELTNKGKVGAYVLGEIYDLIVNDESGIYGSENVVYVGPGKTIKILVPVSLTEQDIAANPTIHVRVRYGEREDTLVKLVVAEFAFQYAKGDIVFYILLGAILILLFLLFRRRKKKDEGYKSYFGGSGHHNHHSHEGHGGNN